MRRAPRTSCHVPRTVRRIRTTHKIHAATLPPPKPGPRQEPRTTGTPRCWPEAAGSHPTRTTAARAGRPRYAAPADPAESPVVPGRGPDGPIANLTDPKAQPGGLVRRPDAGAEARESLIPKKERTDSATLTENAADQAASATALADQATANPNHTTAKPASTTAKPSHAGAESGRPAAMLGRTAVRPGPAMVTPPCTAVQAGRTVAKLGGRMAVKVNRPPVKAGCLVAARGRPAMGAGLAAV